MLMLSWNVAEAATMSWKGGRRMHSKGIVPYVRAAIALGEDAQYSTLWRSIESDSA